MNNNLIKKILLVNDTYDDNNLGCKATTNALYELIEERLPNYDIVDIIKLYHTERHDIMNDIPKIEKDIEPLCYKWLENESYEINKIKCCDVVLINGEGSIYKDVLKGRYQLFLAYLSKVFLNKEVYIVNHTVDTSLIGDMIKKIYPILNGIVVREPYSLRELEALGIENVLLAPDAIFKYTLKTNSEFYSRLPFGFDYKKKFIIIGGTSLNNPIYEKWYGQWDRQSYGNMIRKLKKMTGVQILLADVGGDDFMRSYDIENEIYYGKFSYDDYMLLTSHALLHISGRYHASCLAAISGCPIIGITANTHKIYGLFELLNWNLPIFNFYEINNQIGQIVKVVNEVIENNIYLRKNISKNVIKIRENVGLNVDVLSKKFSYNG